MKERIKKTARKALSVGLAAAMLCGTAAFAESVGFVGEKLGGLTVSAAGTETPASSFTYQKNEYGEISITGFIGSETKVIIPSEIDGCPVTNITYGAFSERAGVISVVIPDGVTSIGGSVFRDCTSLESVVIPDSVTSIRDCAFYNCPNLRSVTLPEGVISIEDYTFYHCAGLRNVYFSNDLTSFGESSFNGCTELTDITIPEGVTSIGGWAFRNCKKLTNVYIPQSVTNIEEGAFYFCEGLEEVNIPSNLMSISDYVFECTAITNAVIPSGATSIGYCAFNNCTKLERVNIPESVTDIGDYAFECCDVLNIYGVSGSYAETYANENNIPFVALAPLTNTSTLNSTALTLGSRIAITGSAEGGSGEYTYSYYYKRPTSKVWKAIGAENTTATEAKFTPTAVGDFDVKVVVKDSDGTEAEKLFAVTIVDGKSKAFENNSTVNVTGAKPGTKIKLTGAAEGSGGYKYAFYYKRTTAKQWYVSGTEFTDKNTAQFTPKTEGEFNVKVDIMDENGEIVSRQFAVSISNDYSVATTAVNKSTISTDSAPAGTKIKVTGGASGGTAPYTYAFYYKKAAANNWTTMGTPFSGDTSRSVTLKNTGDYIFKVCVKDANGGMVSKNFDVEIY